MRTTTTATTPWPPADAAAVRYDGYVWTIYQRGDTLPPLPADDDAAKRKEFDAERTIKEAAEFAAFKARAGQPSYKAAAVKIAAEKLGLLTAIDAAIMALVDKAADKALYVWWAETDAISRGDAQWQDIEAAVAWGKATPAELFDLAARI